MGWKKFGAILIKIAVGLAAFVFAYKTVQVSANKITSIIANYTRSSDTASNRLLGRDE